MSFKLPKSKTTSSGQALLLVLIGMAAAMVLVLSIVSRSITDISLSSKEDEAARAFSAAEAGIEKLLIGVGIGGTSPLDLGNNSFVTGEKTDLALNENSYNFPEGVVSGGYATMWLVDHNDEGKLDPSVPQKVFNNLTVCWGNPVFPTVINEHTPALEIMVYYDVAPGQDWASATMDFSGMRVFKYPFDPNTTRDTNGFNKDNLSNLCEVNGQQYPFQKTIDIGVLSNDLLFVRAKLLYNDVPQAVGFKVTGSTLPSQGQRIVSVGTSGGENGSTRKIEVQQTYKDTLPFIDTTLFSGSDLTK
jgi:hypothetical protein